MLNTLSSTLMRILDLAHMIIVGVLVLGDRTAMADPSPRAPLLALGILAVLWLYPALGLYQTWRGGSKAEELLRAALAWMLVLAVLVLANGFLWEVPLPREALVRAFFLGLASLLLMKFTLRLGLNRLRAQGRNPRRLAVVGEGEALRHTLAALAAHPWAGFQVCGTFGKAPEPGVPYLGTDGALEAYLEQGSGPRIEELWLALPLADQGRIEAVMHHLRYATQTIRYVPDMFGFRLINHSTSQIAGLSVFNIAMTPMTGWNRFVKECMDRSLALAALLALSPLLLLLALAVRLSSPGPVFYRQERVGWHGKPFQMLKFRSMADSSEAEGVVWGSARSKKVTPLGRWLRKTSLDELPQFLNVLRGEMSIVGPRPERPDFVHQFKDEIPGYMQKHLVKAGITGWAQVNGWRGDTDLHQRLEHDLYYISNWSLLFDLRILLQTFLTLTKNAE